MAAARASTAGLRSASVGAGRVPLARSTAFRAYRKQFAAYAAHCPLPGKCLPVQARQPLSGRIAHKKAPHMNGCPLHIPVP